jgi:hypothetical protein
MHLHIRSRSRRKERRGLVYLIEIEDEIELAHIAEVLVHRPHEQMNGLPGATPHSTFSECKNIHHTQHHTQHTTHNTHLENNEFVVGGVNAEHEEQAGVSV